MDERTPQMCLADPQTGRGAGGACGRFRGAGFGAWAAATAVPSAALLALAGVWSFPTGAFGVGPAALSMRALEVGGAAVQTEWRRSGPRMFPRGADGVGSSTPLVLAGVSGEALAVSREEVVPVFAPPRAAPAALIVAGPVSVSDQVTMAAGFGWEGLALHGVPAHLTPTVGRSPARVLAEADMPVPDYALVFARQPDFANPVSSGAGNLEQAALRAGWRAVVEALILTTEPKPTAVHNL